MDFFAPGSGLADGGAATDGAADPVVSVNAAYAARAAANCDRMPFTNA